MQFDIIIIVTPTEDQGVTNFVWQLARTWMSRRQRVLWVIHEPGVDLVFGPEFNETRGSELRSLVADCFMVNRSDRCLAAAQFYTISPGVAAYTKSLLETWSHGLGGFKQAEIPWIVPLFPLSLPNLKSMKNICIQVNEKWVCILNVVKG